MAGGGRRQRRSVECTHEQCAPPPLRSSGMQSHSRLSHTRACTVLLAHDVIEALILGFTVQKNGVFLCCR